MSGFPGVVGAIDGSHIPIKAPTKYPADYFNRKHFYSIVLQAVCDHDGKFIDVFVEVAPHIVMACCILHNICEEKLDFLDYDEIIQDPHHFDDIDHEQEENNVQRDFICNLLWSQRVSNN